MHRLSGHLRVASGGLDDQPQSDVTYCLSRGGRDDNPAIALSGGTGGAKATITAIDGGDACAPGGTATCRTQLCLVFGGNSSIAPPATDPGIPLGPYDNPIPAENAKQGTPASVWNISGAGDQNLQGFTTNISYDQGETVQFKITANVGYRMDIYRLGWYGGDGARKVAAMTRVPRRRAEPVPAAAGDRSGRLRRLVGVRVVADPARRRLGRLLRPPHRQRRRREPHRLRGAQRPLALGHLLPDVRHHLAGLQRLRRQQPLHGRPADGRQHPARVQGQLQPALRHARRPGAARTGSSTPRSR